MVRGSPHEEELKTAEANPSEAPHRSYQIVFIPSLFRSILRRGNRCISRRPDIDIIIVSWLLLLSGVVTLSHMGDHSAGT